MAAIAEPKATTLEEHMDPLDLASVRIDPSWALRIPAAYALRKRVLPLCRLDNKVIVACTRAIDSQTHKALRNYLKCDFSLVEVCVESMLSTLARVYDSPSMTGTLPDVRSLGSPGECDNTIAVCDELLQAAILRGASDIHLVPNASSLSVQLRVDGMLEVYRELPLSLQPLVVSRLKVLAGMDIAEKRAAQDGRITSKSSDCRNAVDIRVATLPTRYGERMTLRLLSSRSSTSSLQSLGMRSNDLAKFSSATARPHGLILLTGPTGSGKSTTLYVAIEQLLQSRGGNVITIEDPIEYEIQGASQVEVDSADKVNFSKALRSVLRHDPDVVMIGEIRDPETAETAVKASLTGHLVFSTVHTNTAAGVVTRLKDMGIEPFLIAATLRLSVAQRLVRKLCSHCRRPRTITAAEVLTLHQPALETCTVFDAAGCVMCAGRGYTGRVALFEMLESSETMAKLIAAGANEDELLQDARSHGTSLLLDDGVAKILEGTTTVAEVTNAVSLW
jgi:general secretion pathway protein E